MRSLVVVAVALVALRCGRADACSRLPFTGLDGFTVVPANDATAPRNTAIWIPASSPDFTPQVVPADIVVEQDGVVIEVAFRAISVAGEVTSVLYVATPTETLVAGASVTVRVRDIVATRFTVLSDEDTVAPATPTLEDIQVTSGYFGYSSCGEPSDVTVRARNREDMLVLTADDAVGLSDSLLGISVTDDVHAIDLESGDHSLQLASVDRAGNVSEPVVLPTLTVPAEVSGCNAGGAPGGTAILLVFAALMRRRRVQNGQGTTD